MFLIWRRSISTLCVLAMLVGNTHAGTVLTAAARPSKPAESEPPNPVKTCKSCKHCSRQQTPPKPAEKPAKPPVGNAIDVPCPCCPIGATCPCSGGCALCSVAKTLCHGAAVAQLSPADQPGEYVAESSNHYLPPAAESLVRPPRA